MNHEDPKKPDSGKTRRFKEALDRGFKISNKRAVRRDREKIAWIVLIGGAFAAARKWIVEALTDWWSSL